MKELYQELIHINQMADDSRKEDKAKAFFNTLNQMPIPDHFNWAGQIFEDFHVKEYPDKTALIWHDIHTGDIRSFTYLALMQKANQLVNFLTKNGVGHKQNM